VNSSATRACEQSLLELHGPRVGSDRLTAAVVGVPGQLAGDVGDVPTIVNRDVVHERLGVINVEVSIQLRIVGVQEGLRLVGPLAQHHREHASRRGGGDGPGYPSVPDCPRGENAVDWYTRRLRHRRAHWRDRLAPFGLHGGRRTSLMRAHNGHRLQRCVGAVNEPVD
jgi:hypothetical protein